MIFAHANSCHGADNKREAKVVSSSITSSQTQQNIISSRRKALNMDANEARRIEKEIIEFITSHFDVEGRSFFEKLQFLAVASRVKDSVKSFQ